MKTHRFVIPLSLMLLLLSSCQFPQVSGLNSRSGDLIYEDDFSSISSGWPEHAGQEGSIGYADGVYRILVDQPGYQMWAVPGRSYRDVQVEVDASRFAGPDENLYGLICRYEDAKNFYYFIISSDGYYAIGKMQDGESSLVGQEMMAYNASILPGEATNHLRFDCIGSTLIGFVNDQMVALTEDTQLVSGDVGLLAGTFEKGGVEVMFDHLVVYKP